LPDGCWAGPVVFGNDLASRAVAEAFAIDHNNLTLAGGDFTARLVEFLNSSATGTKKGTILSKRPGRLSAASSRSGRSVAVRKATWPRREVSAMKSRVISKSRFSCWLPAHTSPPAAGVCLGGTFLHVLQEIERLWDAEPGTPESDTFGMLVTLVFEYEKGRYELPAPIPGVREGANGKGGAKAAMVRCW
jgi:hypothetical protein